MTKIYLIRHAEAEGNLYRRIHGWYNALITPNGYRQIAALEERFASVHVDAVYSSDLFRTMTTASAIWRPKGLPLHTMPELREVHLGDWEDESWGWTAQFDGENLLRFNAFDPTWRAPNGENLEEVRNRMEKAIRKIAADHPDQTVAVFSHGTAIRCVQAAFYGLSVAEGGKLGHSDNTAVTLLEFDGDQVNVVYADDNSHLSEEISTLARQDWWRDKGASVHQKNLWFRPLDVCGSEAEYYFEARREAWKSIHGSMEHFDGEKFLKAAQESAEKYPWSIYCAMLEDRPVGLIQMDFDRYAEEGVGYIPFYYMDPATRKQGFGVQLLGQAVSTYRPLGRDKLRLRCAPDNDVAQRFYQRHGFQKIGEATDSRVPLDLMEMNIGYQDLRAE